MQDDKSNDLENPNNNETGAFANEADAPVNEPKVIKTDAGAKDGQNKCPKCGATDISLNSSTGKLRCNFCRHEFEPEKMTAMQADLQNLAGETIGSGALDIIADTKDVLTFKCSSCGAEVVIDTSEALQARCHWCRNTLSVNQQIPNGSVPDMVLPFGLKKDDAKAQIERFVEKRKFYAHPTFKKEFTTQNIMGVYLPYMLIDINGNAALTGQGERLIRTYTREIGKDKETFYDANLYDVERRFDLVVNDLTVEASLDKLHRASDKTNNIINSVMPFDTENCVKWDANYLKGFTSEKRDTNIDQLRSILDVQAKDIARHQANKVLKEYDRGVRWDSEQLTVKGKQWKSAYLPVWLYSYQQIKSKGKKLLHYVAVNARTKETMGSVPVHKPKLLIISLLIEIFGVSAAVLVSIFFGKDYGWLCVVLGPIYYAYIYSKYRNEGARHHHEKETHVEVSNLEQKDNLVRELTGLKNSSMSGANNKRVGYKA